MCLCRVYLGTLKLHESSIFISWPQTFSFELLMVLKTDFERRSNSFLHGIRLFTVGHVPVDDFRLSILSIFHCKKWLKII